MFRKTVVLVVALVAALLAPAAARADAGLTLSTQSVDYGDIAPGHNAMTGSVTMTNNGASDVTIQSITVDGFWGYAGSGNGCFPGTVIAPTASCTLYPIAAWTMPSGGTTTVTAPLGVDPGAIHVTTDQGTSDIALTATWRAAVAQYVPHNDYWFPQVLGNDARTHTFWVKNDGNADLHVTGVTVTDPQTPASFHVLSDGCSGEPVAPAATCPIKVTFDGPSDYKIGTPQLAVTTDATPYLGAGRVMYWDFTGVRVRRLAVTSHTLSASSLVPRDNNGDRHNVRYSFRTTHPSHVTLQVINADGHVVRSWQYKTLYAGTRSVSWAGKSNVGGYVKPGIYRFRVRLHLWGKTRYGGVARILVKQA